MIKIEFTATKKTEEYIAEYVGRQRPGEALRLDLMAARLVEQEMKKLAAGTGGSWIPVPVGKREESASEPKTRAKRYKDINWNSAYKPGEIPFSELLGETKNRIAGGQPCGL